MTDNNVWNTSFLPLTLQLLPYYIIFILWWCHSTEYQYWIEMVFFFLFVILLCYYSKTYFFLYQFSIKLTCIFHIVQDLEIKVYQTIRTPSYLRFLVALKECLLYLQAIEYASIFTFLLRRLNHWAIIM